MGRITPTPRPALPGFALRSHRPRRACLPWLLPSLLPALLLTACGAPSRQAMEAPLPPASGNRPGGGIRLLTTVPPLTLFTSAIAAGCGRVEPLVSGSRDVHDLRATPADLARLRTARVLVINGLGLEPFVPAMLRAAANPALKVIDSSDGVIPARHNGLADPHIWLDPRRAQDQVRTIRDGLIAADPACASRYRTNASALQGRLRVLDRDLASQLAPWRGAILTTPHAFATSFADRYDLRTEAAVRTPEERPTPEDLRRLMDRLRGPGPRALVVEPGGESGSLEGVAQDLGLRPTSFDPMESGLTPAPGNQPEAPYAATLRSNTRNLVEAFKASSR